VELEAAALSDPTPEAPRESHPFRDPPSPSSAASPRGRPHPHAPRRSSGGGSRGGGGGGGGAGCGGGGRHMDPAAWAAFLAGEGSGDVEVVLRAAHDCTAAARRCGGAAGGGPPRRVLAVAEGDKDRAGLPSVMGQLDALCDLACPGVFDGVA
jgi:hypothetical protein